MTIANNLIALALKSAGINGVGQTASAEDTNDALTLLNDMINQWAIQRTIMVIPGTLATFPNLTADVAYWTGNENVLLTTLAVRLRSAYNLPADDLMNQIAESTLQQLQANNKQYQPAPAIAANDSTGYGLLFLALRACGRITDQQSVATTSQDVTDGMSLLNEMLDDWRLQRTISVIPATVVIPVITNFAATLSLTPGMANAIVLNLAVRMRDVFGLPENKGQEARAAEALSLVQAINLQQVAPLHGGVPTTPIQIIFLALRMAGRLNDKQSVADGSADVDSAFSLLVNMLAQWQRKRWLVPNLIDLSITSTGATSYTIGPARPDRIEGAYMRFLNQGGAITVDYPLEIIESHEDYADITVKNLATIPSAVFYDSAWPVGNVYFWPVPPANAYELHLLFKAPLPTYVTVNDPLGLPYEYNDALVTNLACRLKALNGEEPSPYLAGQARGALNTIRVANTQMSLLKSGGSLGGWGRGPRSAGAFLGGRWS